MKANLARGNDRVSPRRQLYWDWRAAGNFIGGGTGGGLLFFAAWAGLAGAPYAPLALLALALVAGGLLCVWLEIGRPWRALNVFRHLSTSWMTREASVAPLMFLTAALALLFGGPPLLTWSSALLGLAFVYTQARILTADKGIPAWRHPRCMPLVLSTGLVEGAGLLVVVSPWLAPGAAAWLPLLLLVLLAVRARMWQRYRAGLEADGAPTGSLKVLRALDCRLLLVGHGLPALLLVAAMVAGPAAAAGAALAVVGGVLALAEGWHLKYTLVRRAAFNQGFALPHQPVRGQRAGTEGLAAARPGWGGTGGGNI